MEIQKFKTRSSSPSFTPRSSTNKEIMALREIIANLSETLEEDIEKQKGHYQKKFEECKVVESERRYKIERYVAEKDRSLLAERSRSSSALVLREGDGRTSTTRGGRGDIRMPALSWAVSSGQIIPFASFQGRKYGADRENAWGKPLFNMLMLRALRKWRGIVRKRHARENIQSMVVRCMRTFDRTFERERWDFVEEIRLREENFVELREELAARRRETTKYRYVRQWRSLLRARAAFSRTLLNRMFRTWRMKHEQHVRITEFVDFVRARRQLTHLRMWQKRTDARRVPTYFDLFLLRTFRRLRNASREAKITRWFRTLRLKLIRHEYESAAVVRSRLFRSLREVIVGTIGPRKGVVERRRRRFVTRSVCRAWRSLLVARSFMRQRRMRTSYRLWAQCVRRRKNAVELGILCNSRHEKRSLRRWFAAYRLSFETSVLARKADVHLHRHRMRKGLVSWRRFAKREKSRTHLRVLQIRCSVLLARKRARSSWIRWRGKFLRYQYAVSAGAKTKICSRRQKRKVIFQHWLSRYRFRATIRRVLDRAERVSRACLIRRALATWSQYALLHSAAQSRDLDSNRRRLALRRWWRRAVRRRRAREIAKRVELYRRRSRLRSCAEVWAAKVWAVWKWRNAVLGDYLLRKTRRELRAALSAWRRLAMRGRSRRRELGGKALRFWYERLLSKTFNRWSSATLRVLSSDGRW